MACRAVAGITDALQASEAAGFRELKDLFKSLGESESRVSSSAVSSADAELLQAQRQKAQAEAEAALLDLQMKQVQLALLKKQAEGLGVTFGST